MISPFPRLSPGNREFDDFYNDIRQFIDRVMLKLAITSMSQKQLDVLSVGDVVTDAFIKQYNELYDKVDELEKRLEDVSKNISR